MGGIMAVQIVKGIKNVMKELQDSVICRKKQKLFNRLTKKQKEVLHRQASLRQIIWDNTKDILRRIS